MGGDRETMASHYKPLKKGDYDNESESLESEPNLLSMSDHL